MSFIAFVNHTIATLRERRDRISEAVVLLEEIARSDPKRRGRPRKEVEIISPGRRISAEGRARIAAAARERWKKKRAAA